MSASTVVIYNVTLDIFPINFEENRVVQTPEVYQWWAERVASYCKIYGSTQRLLIYLFIASKPPQYVQTVRACLVNFNKLLYCSYTATL